MSPLPETATRTSAPAVELRGVTRLFGVVPALVRVDLNVAPGEVVLLRGPNGAGKTTLLRIAATSLSPTYGGGSVLGFDLVRDREQVRRRVELLSHRTRLYEDLSAAENLAFWCRLLGIDVAGIDAALDRVGLLEVSGERVRGFSQGMRQRVAVARTILRRPELLLLDEPYTGLDAEAHHAVDDLIREASRGGRAVLLATHHAVSEGLVDRELHVDGGRIVREASSSPSRASGSGESLGKVRVSFVRQAVAIAGKDLRIEVRGKHALGTLLPFAATLLVAFAFAFGPGRDILERTAPGLLWMAVLFSAVMAARRSFQAESEDGALEGLLLAPVDKAAVFVGKAAAVALELLALVACVLLLVVVLFDLSIGTPLALAGAFALGAVGLAAVGGLFGVVAEAARTREAIFPMLVLPLVTPVLIAGVRATDLAATGQAAEAASWLGLLVAFDVVFVSVGILVFGYLMED